MKFGIGIASQLKESIFRRIRIKGRERMKCGSLEVSERTRRRRKIRGKTEEHDLPMIRQTFSSSSV